MLFEHYNIFAINRHGLHVLIYFQTFS